MIAVETDEIKEFFNRLAPNWDERCVFNKANIQRILTLAQVGEGNRVIDVGCGTGVMIEPLLACGVSEIYAVDLAEGMIAKAKEKYGQEAAVWFEAVDFLDNDKRGYDCVIVHNAYPHFLDKLALADAIHRSLRVGGRFVIAHSDSRAKINGCHHKLDSNISTYLQAAAIEAQNFQATFDVDIIIDDADIYMISGVRKG